MHVRLVQYFLELVHGSFAWVTAVASGLIGWTVAFFQATTQPTGGGGMSPMWMGIISAFIGGAAGILLKLIDVWDNRRKEKAKRQQDKEVGSVAEQAQDFTEKSSLRQEERNYFNSLIKALDEQKRIASLRGHAMNGEVERLRAIMVRSMMSNGGKLPDDVEVYSQKLAEYLSQLENLPIPEIAPTPESLKDIHRSSSPNLPRMD